MTLKIDVREAILDATEQLLGRFGYRRMTVDDIARAADVGKGTIYLHFPSKDEVALSTIDRIVDKVVGELERIAAGSGSAAQRLRAMLLARVTVRLEAVRGYTDGLDNLLSVIRPALLERRKIWFAREARALAAMLVVGRESGEFTFANATHTADDLLAATASFLPAGLTPAELRRGKKVVEQAGRVADLLLHGLCTGVEPPQH